MSLISALEVRHQLLDLTDHPHAMLGSRGGLALVPTFCARGHGMGSVSRGIVNIRRKNESSCSLCASILIFIFREPIYLVFHCLDVDFVSGDLHSLAPLQLTARNRASMLIFTFKESIYLVFHYLGVCLLVAISAILPHSNLLPETEFMLSLVNAIA